MTHRIKTYENFVSEEECQYAINLINNGRLEKYIHNPEIKILKSAGAEEFVSMISNRIKPIIKEEYGYIPDVKLTEAYLTLWESGSKSGLHIDSHEGYENIIFSFVIYFNSDFTGGQIIFPSQQFELYPDSGSMVIFPSGGREYPHRVEEIRSGKRYTLAGWFVQNV